MKLRSIVLFLAVILMALSVVPAFSGDEKTLTGQAGAALNHLEPLGIEPAPDARTEVTHNTSGTSLELTAVAANLPSQKQYRITSCDLLLGAGVADDAGNLTISVSIKDAEILKTIAENDKRKFSLWLDNTRLAWSADIFEFAFTGK